MKITYIAGFAWEPKGTVRSRAYPLATEMVRRGHEVTIVLAPYDNPAESGREFVLNGVRVVNIHLPATKVPGFAAIPGRILELLDRLDPEIVHVYKPKGFAGLVATRLLDREAPSMVLDCDDWEGWGGWNEVKPYPWVMKEFIDLQERWLVRNTPVLTLASRALQARAEALRHDHNNFFYVPNGLSREQAECVEHLGKVPVQELRKELGLGNGLVIGYASNFDPADDVMFFCRAVIPSAERFGARIAMVGDGPMHDEVRAFFSSHPEVQVEYFGHLPYQQYLRVLAAADILTFPYPDSPIYRAKCSARVIDFMALGKAVLTTALGQNLEYICDGKSGLLTPANDESAYRQALGQLLESRTLRQNLGKNACAAIRRDFSWDGKPADACEQAYRVSLRHSSERSCSAAGL